jgi:hypothetical protein
MLQKGSYFFITSYKEKLGIWFDKRKAFSKQK